MLDGISRGLIGYILIGFRVRIGRGRIDYNQGRVKCI